MASKFGEVWKFRFKYLHYLNNENARSLDAQEVGQHDDWCNIGNQQTNNQSPRKPSSTNTSDEKNDNETTSDKSCIGNDNVKGKNVEIPPSKICLLNLKQTVQQRKTKG